MRGPSAQNAFPDTVARDDYYSNRLYRMQPIETALFDLVPEFDQRLALPFVGTFVMLKLPRLPPGVSPLHKTERIGIEPCHVLAKLKIKIGFFRGGRIH